MPDFIENFSSADPNVVLREQRSVLASYTMRTILPTSSVAFTEDLEQAVDYTTKHTHFADGRLITDEDVNALAASSVLVQMVDSYNKAEPIVLSPKIPRALPVYLEAQAVIDEVGLTLITTDLDLPIVLATARRLNGKDVPTTPTIEAAVTVLNARGTVTMVIESLDDIQAAIVATDYSSEAPDIYREEDDGTRFEGHNMAHLTVPSMTKELPYYTQFSEVEHGSGWLRSLLEDIQAIHANTL